MPDINFTTGPATLPDVGVLAYNGCTFSPLFHSDISGKVVQDEAGRTTKYMEYTITVEGYVTLAANQKDIGNSVDTLRRLLTAQAGTLTYTGRGFNLNVNQPGNAASADVAWGPVPDLLDFTPMGAGRSALVKWAVKVRICELASSMGHLGPVLQFIFETGVAYAEDGYSTLTIRGKLEVPNTRPTQATRTLTSTVDDFRQFFMTRIAAGIDLTRFKVSKRDFNISADRRTLTFDFQADELPPMVNPPNCTIVTGNYSVRPAKQGMGLCNWFCALRVTYTVAKNQPRRLAWLAFLMLLRSRMSASVNANIPSLQGNQNIPTVSDITNAILFGSGGTPNPNAALAAINGFRDTIRRQQATGRKAFLVDLSIDEGLYRESKTVTFSASWKLITTLSHILVASGVWKPVFTNNQQAWANSVQNISGWSSWLTNRIDPAQDFIVDFGSSG